MDLVVRTVQNELAKAGIVPVTNTVDIRQPHQGTKDNPPIDTSGDTDGSATSTDGSTAA